ncbi:MAG: hypothetical protein JO055_15325 [Alphaproteobacteria bacterium]|nr:hypothetical protein [Alphaproteobacteria bacterium]
MRIHPTSALGAAWVMLICCLTGASAQEACPRNLAALDVGGSLTCRCTSDQMEIGGIYGSARYSSDSSLCKAARHAGAIADSGGVVTVYAAEGCPKFVGSTANGVTTSNWGGAVDKTLVFAKPAPACGLDTIADALKPGAAPTATAPAVPGVALCPSFIPADKKTPGSTLTCACDKALDLSIGAAYGVDRYTADSAICIAARHAGKLPEPGGTVTVHVAEGCGKFEGSARHDVTTRSWGSTVHPTIAFITPAPDCAAPPAGAPPTAAAPRRAAPAGPSPIIAWKARAETYAALLPDPLPGWKAGDREAKAEGDTPFYKGSVVGSRYYETGFDPVYRNRVVIAISNHPSGRAGFPIDSWRDPNQRKLQDGTIMTMTTVDGRQAMLGTPTTEGAGTLYFLLKNDLFVSVYWGSVAVTRADAERYLKLLDFAKIEALASK